MSTGCSLRDGKLVHEAYFAERDSCVIVVLRVVSIAVSLTALIVVVLEARGQGRFPLATIVARWYRRPRKIGVSLLFGFALGSGLVLVPAAIRVGGGTALPTATVPTTARWLVLALGSLLIKAGFVFFEEVVSRAALITLLRRRLTWPIAVVVAGVLFSFAHSERSAISLAVLGLDGVLFGSAFVITGSLWLPSAMHMGKNVLVWFLEGGGTLTLVPGPFDITGTTTGPLELVTTLGIVLAALSIMLRWGKPRDAQSARSEKR